MVLNPLSEHDSHSVTWPVQVSIGTVKQEDDGVLHCHLWLVGKLRGVHDGFTRGCRCNRSLQGLSHAFLGTGTRQDVLHSTGTLFRLRVRLKICWSTPQALSTLWLCLLSSLLTCSALWVSVGTTLSTRWLMYPVLQSVRSSMCSQCELQSTSQSVVSKYSIPPSKGEPL